MSKTVTYNLKNLAKFVFNIDEPYDLIFRALISRDFPDKGASQANITEYVQSSERFEKPLSRSVIRKKIFGTKQTMGLLQYDYLMQKDENKHRYKKNEKTYHLTFKGIFGCLSSGIPLSKIYLYDNLKKVISNRVDDKFITKIILEYYEKQLHVFLLWHYLNGMQLTRTTNFQFYFKYFFERIEFTNAVYFEIHVGDKIIGELVQSKIIHGGESKSPRISGVSDKNKRYVCEIESIFKSYFATKGVIQLLRINNLIPTDIEMLKPINKQDAIPAKNNLIFDKLIDQWSVYIESVHKEDSFDRALFSEHYELPEQPKISLTVESIEREVKRILRSGKLKIRIPVDRPTNVYPF